MSHYDHIRDREHHGRMRQQAIRHSTQTQREIQTSDPDTDADADTAVAKLASGIAFGTGTITATYPTWPGDLTSKLFPTISCNLLDPFDSLCESPKRLQQLLRHREAPPPHLSSTLCNR
jgi:hypothetical protein